MSPTKTDLKSIVNRFNLTPVKEFDLDKVAERARFRRAKQLVEEQDPRAAEVIRSLRRREITPAEAKEQIRKIYQEVLEILDAEEAEEEEIHFNPIP